MTDFMHDLEDTASWMQPLSGHASHHLEAAESRPVGNQTSHGMNPSVFLNENCLGGDKHSWTPHMNSNCVSGVVSSYEGNVSSSYLPLASGGNTTVSFEHKPELLLNQPDAVTKQHSNATDLVKLGHSLSGHQFPLPSIGVTHQCIAETTFCGAFKVNYFGFKKPAPIPN
jgi:hypothetical protein